MPQNIQINGKSKYVLMRWLRHNQTVSWPMCKLPRNEVMLEVLDTLGWHFLNSQEVENFANKLRADCPEIVLNKSDFRKQEPQVEVERVKSFREHRSELKRQRKADRKRRRENAKSFQRPKRDSAYNRQAYEALLRSDEWKQLRYLVLRESGGKCSLCGMSRKNGIVIHVDHIVAASVDWSRRLDRTNLQALCEGCNIGKSNFFSDDWR